LLQWPQQGLIITSQAVIQGCMVPQTCSHRRRALLVLLAGAATPLHAQPTFPTHTVKLVVAFPPGSSVDITARILAIKLEQRWGQTVVVENRPGAGASVGTAHVAKSAPDGHTLLLATPALTISPSVLEKPGYDTLRDLTPVALVATIPGVLVVHASLLARTIGEFIAYAKRYPGKLNFAAPGASSGQRMTFELIKQATGTDIVMVAYAGGPQALHALLSGEVDAMILNTVEAASLARTGKLRALAITAAQRNALLPDVPTLAETVAPHVDTSAWQGVLAPAGTPPDVIQAIERDIRAVLALHDVREQLGRFGLEIVPATHQTFSSLLREDLATWRRVGKAAGVTPG
jgi:tripartite-type tricarboxylate transporter receptor subunit TctC